MIFFEPGDLTSFFCVKTQRARRIIFMWDSYTVSHKKRKNLKARIRFNMNQNKMPRVTKQSFEMRLPDNYTNVKIDPTSLGNIFSLIKDITTMKNDNPETDKKLNIWSNLLRLANKEQLDKIVPVHINTITELLVGTIGEFKQENMKDILSDAMEEASEIVQKDLLPEAKYKMICDYSMWMLNILKSIDGYNGDKDEESEFEIGFTSRYVEFKGQNVIDLYIYKSGTGSF